MSAEPIGGFVLRDTLFLATLNSPSSVLAHIFSALKIRLRCQSQRAISPIGLSSTMSDNDGMVRLEDLAAKIAEIRNEPESIEEFERWIRGSSRNMHAWGSEELIEAVLAVEAALSEYRFGGLSPAQAQEELANAIRPFVPSTVEEWKVAPALVPDEAPIQWSGPSAPQELLKVGVGVGANSNPGAPLASQSANSNATWHAIVRDAA